MIVTAARVKGVVVKRKRGIMKLYDTDYVIIDKNTLEPIESIDIIYCADSLKEELEESPLGNNEIAMPMTKLPKQLQDRYINYLIDNAEWEKEREG